MLVQPSLHENQEGVSSRQTRPLKKFFTMQVYLIVQPGVREHPEWMTAVPAAQMRGASEDGFPGWRLEEAGQDANDIPDPVSCPGEQCFCPASPCSIKL